MYALRATERTAPFPDGTQASAASLIARLIFAGRTPPGLLLGSARRSHATPCNFPAATITFIASVNVRTIADCPAHLACHSSWHFLVGVFSLFTSSKIFTPRQPTKRSGQPEPTLCRC